METELKKDPVEGFAVDVNEENLFEWKVFLEGPKDTFYEGGIFELRLKFTEDYPMVKTSVHEFSPISQIYFVFFFVPM